MNKPFVNDSGEKRSDIDYEIAYFVDSNNIVFNFFLFIIVNSYTSHALGIKNQLYLLDFLNFITY